MTFGVVLLGFIKGDKILGVHESGNNLESMGG